MHQKRAITALSLVCDSNACAALCSTDVNAVTWIMNGDMDLKGTKAHVVDSVHLSCFVSGIAEELDQTELPSLASSSSCFRLLSWQQLLAGWLVNTKSAQGTSCWPYQHHLTSAVSGPRTGNKRYNPDDVGADLGNGIPAAIGRRKAKYESCPRLLLEQAVALRHTARYAEFLRLFEPSP